MSWTVGSIDRAAAEQPHRSAGCSIIGGVRNGGSIPRLAIGAGQIAAAQCASLVAPSPAARPRSASVARCPHHMVHLSRDCDKIVGALASAKRIGRGQGIATLTTQQPSSFPSIASEMRWRLGLAPAQLLVGRAPQGPTAAGGRRNGILMARACSARQSVTPGYRHLRPGIFGFARIS